MHEIFIHALIDSAKVFVIALLIYVILSFIEDKLSYTLSHNKKMSPVIGASFGMIPQCGISIVAADLYQKRHISMGTILAVFFACSDEALPILLSDKDKAIMVLPLLLIKFVFGFLLGYIIDLIFSKDEIKHEEKLEEVHIGCCGHEIDNHEETKVKKHLYHPILHSIKIFIYVFIVNVIFGLIIHYITEDRLISFMESKSLLSPVITCLVGLIPNCASSVLITELYLHESISFGALTGGLCINAGLGFVYLFKFKGDRLNCFKIMGILFGYSLLVSYLIVFVTSIF